MSNLVPSNIQVPAHLVGRIGKSSALAQALTGGISSGESIPRISIKGGRFRIVEGGNETILDTTKLDVIIVGANPRLSKAWYSKAWSKEAEPTAPDCFSLDGIGPHTDSTNPQNDLCASCPHNAWGSKVTDSGQQIKACPDQKRLAVVAADDPSGPIYLLQVTPAALKGLNAYQKELSMRGFSPEIVKTRITFDTDASFPKIMFGFGGFIDDQDQATVDTLFGSQSVREITGEASGHVGARPATAALPAAKSAPAPVEEEAPAAPVRGFGAKAAPKAAPKKPVEEPKAAPVLEATDSLAAEIAALVGGINADDE